MLPSLLVTALSLLAVSSPVAAKAKKEAPAAAKAPPGGPAVSLRAGTEKTVPLRTHSLYAREPHLRPERARKDALTALHHRSIRGL